MNTNNTRQHLVYDVPTRFFHWLFAGLFLTAFFIGKTVDNESLLFTYHMLAGITMVFLVLLRIVWGIFGTRHAKFKNFALNPFDMLKYFKGILSGDKTKWAGHNPASSWAGIVMMLLALGLGFTGYMMTSGSGFKEDFEDIHELLANAFIVVVILHVLGIVLHTLRHREMIGLSMIDGRKADVPAGEQIKSSYFSLGLLFLGIVMAFMMYLAKNYDTQNRTLQIFGSTLQLGENESERGEDGMTENGAKEKSSEKSEDGDDD